MSKRVADESLKRQDKGTGAQEVSQALHKMEAQAKTPMNQMLRLAQLLRDQRLRPRFRTIPGDLGTSSQMCVGVNRQKDRILTASLSQVRTSHHQYQVAIPLKSISSLTVQNTMEYQAAWLSSTSLLKRRPASDKDSGRWATRRASPTRWCSMFTIWIELHAQWRKTSPRAYSGDVRISGRLRPARTAAKPGRSSSAPSCAAQKSTAIRRRSLIGPVGITLL